MQHHLKMLGKRFGLLALSCVLLAMGLLGLQQHPATAYASTAFDMYVWTSSGIWGHNGSNSVTIDNGFDGLTSGGQANNYGPITSVIARGRDVFEQRGRFLFQIVLGGCPFIDGASTGYCLAELDDNPATTEVSIGGNGQLYQLHTPTGSLWKYDGGGFHSWTSIDDNPLTSQIVADSSGHVYQLRSDSTVWQYNGSPFNWTEIDYSPFAQARIVQLALDANGRLYDLRMIFDSHSNLTGATTNQYKNSPFLWTTIDSTPNPTSAITVELLAGSNVLYQQRLDHSFAAYNASTTSWITFDTDSRVTVVATGTNSDNFYKEFADNSVREKTPLSSQYVLISAPFSQFVSMAGETNG